MNPPVWVWAVSLLFVGALFGFEMVSARRQAGDDEGGFSHAEAVSWVVGYVSLAVLFGFGLWLFVSPDAMGQFFAAYVTEYSLSVDNVFVFMVVLASFRVPGSVERLALFWGILIALVLRAVMIVVGVAALERFTFTFLIFGAFLLFTAFKVFRSAGVEDDGLEGEVVEPSQLSAFLTRFLPTTPEWHGSKFFIKGPRSYLFTPLFLTVVSLGLVDVVFALDSIPAVLGLTTSVYIVVMSNVLALAGLRQLYVVLSNALTRLVYLSYALAFVLLFVGLKLLIEGVNTVWNLGLPLPSTPVSLLVIVGALSLAVVASLSASHRLTRASHIVDEPPVTPQQVDDFPEGSLGT
jgi:tellurite resistance protein TerC